MRVSSRSLVLPIFTQEELALELEWLKIRDLFFGEHKASQDIPRALELAAACQHRDAMYLTESFAGENVKTKEEAREVFLAQTEDDARALCFSEVLSSCGWDWQRVRRSAELGFAFAQAKMGQATGGEERVKFAQASADQRERDGFFWMGFCFRFEWLRGELGTCERELLDCC